MSFTHLALGDSYTAGTGANPGEGWPIQLAHLLGGRDIPAEQPHLVARNGWSSANLLTALSKANFQRTFDIVTLMIGANDQFDDVPLQNYERNFRQLLAKAIALADNSPNRVVVISIPDWSITPFAESFNRGDVSTQIEQFNTIIHREAQSTGCRYVDISPVYLRTTNDPTLLGPDKLHPSGKMYASWAQFLLPVVEDILSL